MSTVAEPETRLEAGREMDALIAVLLGDVQDEEGWWASTNGDRISAEDGGPRYYSTRWDEAGRVLDFFTAKEYGKVKLSGSFFHGWICSFCYGPGADGSGESHTVFGVTGPEAICRAALAVVEQENS